MDRINIASKMSHTFVTLTIKIKQDPDENEGQRIHCKKSLIHTGSKSQSDSQKLSRFVERFKEGSNFNTKLIKAIRLFDHRKNTEL